MRCHSSDLLSGVIFVGGGFVRVIVYRESLLAYSAQECMCLLEQST